MIKDHQVILKDALNDTQLDGGGRKNFTLGLRTVCNYPNIHLKFPLGN